MAHDFQYSAVEEIGGTVTDTGVKIADEDGDRSYVVVVNHSSSAWIFVGVGRVPPGGKGIGVPPGSSYPMVMGDNLSALALYLRAAPGASVQYSGLIGRY